MEFVMSTASPPLCQIVCRAWTPAVKGSRAGFVDLALPSAGIVIRGAVLHRTPTNKRWLAWPAVQTGRGYASCFSFMPDTDRERWQAAAVAAIDRFIAGLDQKDSEMPLLMP